MTQLLHINQAKESEGDAQSAFKEQVKIGLSGDRKQLQSKFFYDDKGCKLFNQISRHPDYYLTRSELEILNTYKKNIAKYAQAQPFNLVELGPGEGLKTKILIEQFLQDKLQFCYMPIDISTNFLEHLADYFTNHLPTLSIVPIHSDYFDGLEWLSKQSKRHNFVLFLGSSIGNFNIEDTLMFLKKLSSSLNEGDLTLVGFDLRKDVDILMRAYNDSSGLTREFNFNLLHRINREMFANFDINKFRHYAAYNVYTGAMESYLISLEKQEIAVNGIDKVFYFDAIEPIHVEYSYKYLIRELNDFAEETGFEIIDYYLDAKSYFVDALWRRK